MILAKNGKCCGRGVLALKSWEPLRKPGGNATKNPKENTNNSTSGQSIPQPPGADGSNSTLLAKYSYKAHPDQPGGFHELTIKQGAKVQFLNVHPEQPLWWNVKEQGGSSGYVPASYMMVMNDKPTSLPWLENKRLEEKKEELLGKQGNAAVNTWKPYVSAYGGGPKSGPAGIASDNQERKYYCEVCDKQLNGPKPYQAHIVSKAHKEEVEAQSYNP